MNVQDRMHYTSQKKWTGYLNFLLIKEKIKTLKYNSFNIISKQDYFIS